MEKITYGFQRRVRYYETDMMGYVHNSNVFRFFENGREETMRHFGLSYKDIENKGIMMPLVEQYAHYHIPAVYDELITIYTTISELSAAKIKFSYEIFGLQNEKKILHYDGYNVLCFVDSKTRKPMRFPQWIKDFFQKILSEQ